MAAGDTSSTQHEQALSELCQSYWYPLYAYLRRRGYNSHQAEDYTQSFFAQIIEKKYLSQVEPKSGKFRSFLLVALKHFVSNQQASASAIKRGGSSQILSIDIETAEGKYSREPDFGLSPDKLFERSWALEILNKTMSRLEKELTNMNKKELFRTLKIFLVGDKEGLTYNDVAVILNMTEQAVKVAVYRLRNRYREMLREEIAQTVTTHEQINEEISALFDALSD